MILQDIAGVRTAYCFGDGGLFVGADEPMPEELIDHSHNLVVAGLTKKQRDSL